MTKKIFRYAVIAGIISFIAIAIFAIYLINKNIQDLPDYESLREYEPIITTRLYAADGRLVSEYSKEKRVFVAIENMPKNLINAFLAAEDDQFYDAIACNEITPVNRILYQDNYDEVAAFETQESQAFVEAELHCSDGSIIS